MNVGFLEQFHMWAKKKKIFSSFIPLALFCFFFISSGTYSDVWNTRIMSIYTGLMG